MKMLFIHCSHFSYLTTKATQISEDIQDGCKSCALKDVLVIFITTEKYDIKNSEKIIEKSIEEINIMTKRLGVNNLAIFPFAHLSEETSNPYISNKIIKELYKRIKSRGYSVDKVPFGWEKIFSLTSKGHPLSESLRTIKP